jgi:hypothetical protein
MQFKGDYFPGAGRINMVDFLVQMAVIRHTGLTLFFVAGGQPKTAIVTTTAHGLHNRGDHDLPLAWRMAQ